MESLFSKLYTYRQRENKSDLENFSTELLSYCVKTDKKFKKDFLKLINCIDDDIIYISTQQSYPVFGRPDIQIETERCIILIENKVDSPEGENQLNRYTSILQTSKKIKHLIFLTKFYEHKDIEDNVIYSNIKWWDVSSLINENNDTTTILFKEFLIENRVSMDNNFTHIDLVTLENITNVISKMDEGIDSIREYFTPRLGSFSKDSSRSTRLGDGGYYIYKNVGNPHKFNIDLGYYWYWAEETIYLGLRVWIPFKNSEKDYLKDFFNENLKSTPWEKEIWEKSMAFGIYRKLNEVIAIEEEQLPSITKFFKENIDTLYNLKILNPSIFA
ncbi:PD-(D/E)XK nuclease family protein [Mucilaginibacter terrae]|uniref:PD-(D/E)XK nuclease family protein n=1 Tax=Mucilaginibacter terrae TaxID=1955052 RepID=UPI00363F2B05